MKIHEKEHCEFFESEIKKEKSSQQNFYLYGTYLELVLVLDQQFLVKKQQCCALLQLKR